MEAVIDVLADCVPSLNSLLCRAEYRQRHAFSDAYACTTSLISNVLFMPSSHPIFLFSLLNIPYLSVRVSCCLCSTSCPRATETEISSFNRSRTYKRLRYSTLSHAARDHTSCILSAISCSLLLQFLRLLFRFCSSSFTLHCIVLHYY